jgi:ribonuclease BN (tRNA processing enzyme)
MMKLTILGNNGPFPGAGGACSGYLLSNEKCNILLDCGNGVLSNLQKLIPLKMLDAIILTHLHSDHISDMMVLRYAIQIKNKRG